MISCFVPEIFKFFYYVNLVTDDVISCASTAARHKTKNISANNEAMLLKLGRVVAPYKIYQKVHILMLLGQHTQFQSLASSKLNINYHLRLNQANCLDLLKRYTSSTFHWVSSFTFFVYFAPCSYKW